MGECLGDSVLCCNVNYISSHELQWLKVGGFFFVFVFVFVFLGFFFGTPVQQPGVSPTFFTWQEVGESGSNED